MSARGTGYASGILSRNSQVGDRYKQYSKAYRRTEDLLVLYERSVFYQVFYSSEHLADRKLNFQDLHRAPVPPARAEPSGSSGRHRRQRRSQALASYVARRVSCTPLCSRLLFTPSCLAPRRTAASAAAARRRRRRRRCRPAGAAAPWGAPRVRVTVRVRVIDRVRVRVSLTVRAGFRVAPGGGRSERRSEASRGARRRARARCPGRSPRLGEG